MDEEEDHGQDQEQAENQADDGGSESENRSEKDYWDELFSNHGTENEASDAENEQDEQSEPGDEGQRRDIQEMQSSIVDDDDGDESDSSSSGSSSSSSNSSTSSKKSKKSDDGGDGGQGSEQAAATPATAARRERAAPQGHTSHPALFVPGGYIKLDDLHHNFIAYCTHPDHPRCIKTRRWNKHPLGFLPAWLADGPNHNTGASIRKDHFDYLPPYEDRVQAREDLSHRPGADMFFQREGNGQLVTEPVRCP